MRQPTIGANSMLAPGPPIVRGAAIPVVLVRTKSVTARWLLAILPGF